MNKQQMISLGVAGGLVFLAATGRIKNPAIRSAALAVGAVSLARRTPIVSAYLG